jgi:RNA polymerase sigma-70 factor, ECF subfamily
MEETSQKKSPVSVRHPTCTGVKAKPKAKAKAKTKAELAADRRLLEAVARGESPAQRTLVERLYNRVISTSRYLSRDPIEAEDLAQEALLAVITAARSYGGHGVLEAWADVITVRTIRHRLRRLRWTRWLQGTPLPERGELRDPATMDPEQQLVQRTRTERLGELLARLNDEQHLALVLKLVHGYSVAEVAELMTEPPDRVRYLLRRGRKKLRKLLQKDPVLGELLAEKTT